MAKTLPKVWNTRFPQDPRSFVGMDFRLADNQLSNRVIVSNAFNYPDGKPLPASLVPECFFSKAAGEPLKNRDWVSIIDGLYMISERFRNVLVGFDLGSSQIFEVPLVDSQGVRQPGHWYLFHISEMKTCLVPEQSRGIKKGEIAAEKWSTRYSPDELLAVTAMASEGVDLWLDTHFFGGLFLSDRLKSALTSAGIRSPGMRLHRCHVVG